MRFVNFTKDTFLFQFHKGPIKAEPIRAYLAVDGVSIP